MPFTPVDTALGGLLLHLSASSLLADNGRVLGISGVIDGALLGGREAWRWSVMAGLFLGPALAALTGLSEIMPDPGLTAWVTQSAARLGLAGFLVGTGAKASGRFGCCTSGHMLCGVSRFAPRSLAATAMFFTTAVLTANLWPGRLHVSTPAYVLATPPLADIAILSLVVALFYLAVRATGGLVASFDRVPPIVRLVPYFLAGLTFSLGLSMSGMVSPLKVISFLRILPPWQSFDPSLVMVILTGVVPNSIHYARLLRTAGPSKTPSTRYAWEAWRVPSGTAIDFRLLSGAALFGIGWGLGGICPGPAIVSVGRVLVDSSKGMDLMPHLRGWGCFAFGVVAGMRVARVLTD